MPYLQFAASVAWLELRRKNAAAALARADAGLAHLNEHSGTGHFPFLRAELLYVRGAALLALQRRAEAVNDVQAAIALMTPLHSPESPMLRHARSLLSSAKAG